MTIYYIFYGAIVFLEIFLANSIKNKNKRENIICFICFISIFLLLALRHQSMGVDLAYKSMDGYLGFFETISKISWKSIFTTGEYKNYEFGYILLNKVVGVFTNERQVFLAVCALITIFPIAYTIKKKSDNPFFSFIIFMGLPVFLLLFSGLRQSIGVAVCIFSLKYIEEKKLIKFLIIVLIASLFHSSALIFIIAYPVYHIKVSKDFRIFSVLLIPIVFIFRNPLFSLLSKIFKDNAVADDNGAITLFIFFTLIYGFCIFFSSKDIKQNGYLNIFFLACLCQAFSGVYSIATRVSYYFMISLVFLLPNIIANYKDKNTKNLIYIIIVVCFIAFGLFSLSRGGWAMTNPYIPFWQELTI